MNTTTSTTVRLLLVLLFALTGASSPARADEYQEVSQLMAAGKLSEALKRTETFLLTKPGDPQMRFVKGVLQRNSGKQAEAIVTFTKLTEDYPALSEPYNNLAVIYAGQNQFEKAKAALEMAIRTNPSYATAYENLGDVYVRLASQTYNKALELDKSNTALPTKLAIIREAYKLNASNPAAAPAKPVVSAKETAPAPAPVAAPLPVPVPVPLAPSPVPARVAPVPVPMPEPLTPAPAPSTAPVPRAPSAAAPLPELAPSAPNKGRNEVEQAVLTWAQARSNQDVATYLGGYSKNFNPPGGQSRAAWVQERQAQMGKKAALVVSIEALSIKLTPTFAVASFRENLRLGASAEVNQKTLELTKVADQWLIVKETVAKP